MDFVIDLTISKNGKKDNENLIIIIINENKNELL